MLASVAALTWAELPGEGVELSSWVLLYLLVFHEGMLVDGLHHISEENFGSESITMVDHWLSIWAIPTVNCQNQSHINNIKSGFLISLEIPETFVIILLGLIPHYNYDNDVKTEN